MKKYDPIIFEEEHIHWPKAWVTCYWFPQLKSGKVAKRPEYSFRYFTPLHNCGCCGKLKTPRKLRATPYEWYRDNHFKRWTLEELEQFEFNKYYYVCIGCWNKLIAIKNKHLKSIELEKAIKELKSINYQKRKEEKQCQI